jgi:hypothetical protein
MTPGVAIEPAMSEIRPLLRREALSGEVTAQWYTLCLSRGRRLRFG